MSATVCKHCGVVEISRHYWVAMGLCCVSRCFERNFVHIKNILELKSIIVLRKNMMNGAINLV